MIQPQNVHDTLKKHQLVDGYPLVLDLEKSKGAYLHDSKTGKDYLDFFTCFASWPLGFNHPGLTKPEFLKELMTAALNNPANSDLYTVSMARFVETFAEHVTPKGFPHHFWVSGGALAVENALKVAFDWKAKKQKVTDDGKSLVILHFKHAFHGRSGYTMSLTNTDPTKVSLFPKFDWPRVSTPAIEYALDGSISNDIEAAEAKSCAEIEAAFAKHKDRIAGILIEPMQGEGGDNHFRPEFLQKLRDYADKHEALLMFDEVQTGFFGSGAPWLWQKKGVAPDVVAFGKKAQVCGLYASKRVDDVPDNVFAKSSRINSTWGGSLVDMVRSRRFIEIIRDEDLCAKINDIGQEFIDGLREIASEKSGISNVRGEGSLVAFTLESAEARNQMLCDMMGKGLLALACGDRHIRFRLPLITTSKEIGVALKTIRASLPAGVRA